MPEDNGGERT